MIPVLDSILSLANKFIPDTNAQEKLKAEVAKQYESSLQKAIDADKDIRLAEIRQGGLASVWRPIAALSVFGTLFLHWFIFPLTSLIIVVFDLNAITPITEPLPLEYYGLAAAFVSIYAYGRSQEKAALNITIGKK